MTCDENEQLQGVVLLVNDTLEGILQPIPRFVHHHDGDNWGLGKGARWLSQYLARLLGHPGQQRADGDGSDFSHCFAREL